MRLRQPHVSPPTFLLSLTVSFFHSVFLQRVALPHVASTHTYTHTAHAFMQRVERWLYTCNTLKRLTHFVNMTNPLSASRPTSPASNLLVCFLWPEACTQFYWCVLVNGPQWSLSFCDFIKAIRTSQSFLYDGCEYPCVSQCCPRLFLLLLVHFVNGWRLKARSLSMHNAVK